MTLPDICAQQIIIGYDKEHLSTGKLAEILDCSRSGVYYQLVKYKIKRRKPGRKRKSITSQGKYCSICNKLLPLDYFAIARSKPNGFKSECKNCHNQIIRDRRKKHNCALVAAASDRRL